MSISIRILAWSISLMVVGSGLKAADPEIKATTAVECTALMNALGLDSTSDDSMEAVRAERYSLTALLAPGVDNLAYQHPWLVMSAPQRALDLFTSHGVSEVSDARSGYGRLKRYGFFSNGVDAVGGMFINGNLQALERLVSYADSKASGSLTAQNVPSLIGPPGTGKSHTMTLIRAGLRYSTTMVPENFLYTFEWIDLDQIPALRGEVADAYLDPAHPKPLKDFINDSPFALFPPDVGLDGRLTNPIQDKILEIAGPAVLARIHKNPLPKRELNPWSAHIRDRVLEHYRNTELGGRNLRKDEVLHYLNKHVRIRRLILGDKKTSPILPYAGREPDLPGLFVGPNALVRLILGAEHPMATNPGIIPAANGGFTLFDELLKNEPSFTSLLLNLFSSGSVIYSGTNISTDIFFMAASNTQDVKKLREKDPQSPLLDRNNQIWWPLLTYPEEIGRTLAMELTGLEIRALPMTDAADWIPARGRTLFELYPERKAFETVVTPHERYAMRLPNSVDHPISIAPHTLEFMTDVITLSRMNFDATKVKFAGSFPMLQSNSALFLNPATRLRAVLGQMNVEPAALEELYRLSAFGDDGSFGITHRDTQRWFERMKMEASKDLNHQTITPLMVFETLIACIEKKEILEEDPAAQNQALVFARIVLDQFLIPALRDDLHYAATRADGKEILDATYDEVIQEILALSRIRPNEDTPRTYLWPKSNERKAINFPRLEEIKKTFKEKTGRALDIGEVGTWAVEFMAVNPDATGPNVRRNRELLRAIAEFQMKETFRRDGAHLNRLLMVATDQADSPNSRETERAGELVSVLMNELGYNVHAANKALQMVLSHDANVDSRRAAAQ